MQQGFATKKEEEKAGANVGEPAPKPYTLRLLWNIIIISDLLKSPYINEEKA